MSAPMPRTPAMELTNRKARERGRGSESPRASVCPELGVGTGRVAGAAALGGRPVHVPLEVADGVVAEQPVEGADDELLDVLSAEVEQQLVAYERRGPALDPVHPLGVLGVELGAG